MREFIPTFLPLSKMLSVEHRRLVEGTEEVSISNPGEVMNSLKRLGGRTLRFDGVLNIISS